MPDWVTPVLIVAVFNIYEIGLHLCLSKQRDICLQLEVCKEECKKKDYEIEKLKAEIQKCKNKKNK